MSGKIHELLLKANVSEELASNIVNSLEQYRTTLREQFEVEYAAKVDQAKKVCIEETEAHKRELSRRVQIFCETKGAAVEAHLAKQSALSESEATAKLTELRALLEGVTLHAGPNGTAQAGLEKVKKQAQLAVEGRNKAVTVANRQTAIAEKALKKNRELAAINARLKKQISEGTQKPKKTVSESRKQQSRRIDGQRRKSAKRVSSQPTLVESQDRRTPPQSKQPHVTGTGSGNQWDMGNIANQVDEDLI